MAERRLTCPLCWSGVKRVGHVTPIGGLRRKHLRMYRCISCDWRGLFPQWRKVYHCKCYAEFLKPETRYVGTVKSVLRGNQKLRLRNYCPACKRWLR